MVRVGTDRLIVQWTWRLREVDDGVGRGERVGLPGAICRMWDRVLGGVLVGFHPTLDLEE